MESKAQEVMGLISAEDLDLTEYSDALVYRIIERITVLSKEEIRIRFVGDLKSHNHFTKKQVQRNADRSHAVGVSLYLLFSLRN